MGAPEGAPEFLVQFRGLSRRTRDAIGSNFRYWPSVGDRDVAVDEDCRRPSLVDVVGPTIAPVMPVAAAAPKPVSVTLSPASPRMNSVSVVAHVHDIRCTQGQRDGPRRPPRLMTSMPVMPADPMAPSAPRPRDPARRCRSPPSTDGQRPRSLVSTSSQSSADPPISLSSSPSASPCRRSLFVATVDRCQCHLPPKSSSLPASPIRLSASVPPCSMSLPLSPSSVSVPSPPRSWSLVVSAIQRVVVGLAFEIVVAVAAVQRVVTAVAFDVIVASQRVADIVAAAQITLHECRCWCCCCRSRVVAAAGHTARDAKPPGFCAAKVTTGTVGSRRVVDRHQTRGVGKRPASRRAREDNVVGLVVVENASPRR